MEKYRGYPWKFFCKQTVEPNKLNLKKVTIFFQKIFLKNKKCFKKTAQVKTKKISLSKTFSRSTLGWFQAKTLNLNLNCYVNKKTEGLGVAINFPFSLKKLFKPNKKVKNFVTI